MVVCEHRHEEMPGTERLLSDAERGRFKRVVVVALDRFGRSNRDAIDNFERLDTAGVQFGSADISRRCRHTPTAPRAYVGVTLGATFWLSAKTLSGSYLSFSATSRLNLSWP